MRLSLFSLALATPSQGSGYVGDRRPDLMKLQDQGSRGMTIREAPDGSVYTGDWYDARAEVPTNSVHLLRWRAE